MSCLYILENVCYVELRGTAQGRTLTVGLPTIPSWNCHIRSRENVIISALLHEDD